MEVKNLASNQCCGASPFLTGSGSSYLFITSSGSFSYKNRLKSSKNIFTPALTKKYRLRNTASNAKLII